MSLFDAFMLDFLADRTAMGIGSGLYTAAFLLALFTLFKQQARWYYTFTFILYTGFLAHTLGLYQRGVMIHTFPLTNPFEIVQTLAWAAIALNLVLRQLFKLRLLQFFSSGLGAFLTGITLLIPSWDYAAYPTALTGNPWVGFHAGLAIFSYSVFGILAITSLMYLIQNYGLQHMCSGTIFARLPAIRQLEEINSKLIMLGVSILSIAITIGLLNWIAEPGTIGLVKLVVAIAVWSAYIILLLLRKKTIVVAAPFAQACVGLFFIALISLWPLTRRGDVSPAQDPPSSKTDVSN